MAAVAILHLWAYPYEPYNSNRKEMERESVPGEPTPRHGGVILSSKAILDALNIWDLVKAIGRSARWAFKGRKSRHLDASYDLINWSQADRVAYEHSMAPNLPTAYTGPRPPGDGSSGHSSSAYGGGGQGLLGSARPMPTPIPNNIERRDVSPYGQGLQASPYREPPNLSDDQMNGSEWGAPIYISEHPPFQSDERIESRLPSRMDLAYTRDTSPGGFFLTCHLWVISGRQECL